MGIYKLVSIAIRARDTRGVDFNDDRISSLVTNPHTS